MHNAQVARTRLKPLWNESGHAVAAAWLIIKCVRAIWVSGQKGEKKIGFHKRRAHIKQDCFAFFADAVRYMEIISPGAFKAWKLKHRPADCFVIAMP